VRVAADTPSGMGPLSTRCPPLPCRAPAIRAGDTAGILTGADTETRRIHGVNLSLSYAYSPTDSYTRHGYTEFIELRFATAVYPQQIFVGENRGMCSITRIMGRLSTESQYITLWTGQANAQCEVYHVTRRMYRTFAPLLCEHPQMIDSVRLELNTRTVDDWNEIDYVRLVGSTVLPTSILPHGMRGVVYEPNDGFAGVDDFDFSASQCPYQVRGTAATSPCRHLHTSQSMRCALRRWGLAVELESSLSLLPPRCRPRRHRPRHRRPAYQSPSMPQ
jgi:hypothetical protein